MKFLADLRRDLGLGIRLIARYRGFSAIAIATLAVAIGGNAAVFSIVDALLLTPPPVREPAQLVRIDTGQSLASWPTYEDLRNNNSVFSDVAAYRLVSARLEHGGGAVSLRGHLTSLNYFTVLGVPPEQGRPYADGDPAVDRVVLADHAWRDYFGSDPNLVGQIVRLGGRTYQVAAVMPRGFRGVMPPGVRIDFWSAVDSDSRDEGLRNRLLSQFDVIARLKPGVDRNSATAELRVLADRLRREHPELPESFPMTEAQSIGGVYAFQGMASLLLPVFGFLALLAVVSAFVLVIGCSNIAGLLVGRVAMRQREIAVRLALGSGRARLLRQLVTESLVLALAGGAAGLLVATGLVAIVQYAVTRLPVPLDLQFTLDYRVIGYVLALSTGAAVFFGLAPARSSLRADLVSSLKTDGTGTPERQRLRRAMVLTQVTICSALVVWSALFVRSLGSIYSVDPGFEPRDVLIATVALDRGAIDAARGDQILTEWTQEVGQSAGVETAAIANVVPLALTGREEFDVSLPSDSEGTRRRVVANRITPGWLSTVRIPLVAGRDFAWSDRDGAPPVAIVNETMARQFWAGDAIGQRILFGGRSLDIVGVARDSRYRTLGETTRPLIYLPLRQGYTHFVTLHARTSAPQATTRAMTSAFQRLVPGADATDLDVQSMSDAVAVAVLPAQIGATATGAFGALALVLAACGLYGLVSFTVIQRTREIGIRRAIGASSSDIVRLVVRHHAPIVGVGLAAGLAVGGLGATLLRGFLAGVGPADPLAFFAALVLVGGSAAGACIVPAMRASRVDPMVALRDP